jgi:PAS domain S-box-containing protein
VRIVVLWLRIVLPRRVGSGREAAMSAEAIWLFAERRVGHIAEIAPHEAVLAESLRRFTTHGLSQEQAVLLVLIPSHRELLVQQLNAGGFDVAGLQRDGHVVLCDAADLLTSFMRDGMPNATFFKMRIDELVATLRSTDRNRTVRVFSEMVDLLWRANPAAAIRLEQLWDDVIERSQFGAFCAYSTSHVYEKFPAALRTPHSHIITSAIAEASRDAIVGHTLEQNIIYWNRGAERMYGYAAYEAIGRPSSSLMPRGENELPGVIERIRRGENVEPYEARRLRKDGSVIDVSIIASPIMARDGEIAGVSVIGRGISDRMLMEEASLRLAAIVESSEDAIIAKTLDTTVTSWNRGAENLYGYAAAEMIGRPISVLLPPGAEDEVPAIMERVRRGEKVESYDTKRRRKDGTLIDVSVTVSPIKLRGKIIGASAVARDISERKKAEAARVQIAVLEQAGAAHQRQLERVLEAQEQERRRIARELHDEAGQLMASLLVGLRALEDADTVEDAKAQARRLRGIAAQAIDEVGRLIRGLHSNVLENHGLAVALRRYAAEYSETYDIAADLALSEPDTIDLPSAVQYGVFRIVQEALTNVARHSGATAVSIRVVRSATVLETMIADNGSGFDAAAEWPTSPPHFGLQGMRERAALLGGTVSVRSGATGTTILVHIPVEQAIPGARGRRAFLGGLECQESAS